MEDREWICLTLGTPFISSGSLGFVSPGLDLCYHHDDDDHNCYYITLDDLEVIVALHEGTITRPETDSQHHYYAMIWRRYGN